MTIDSKKDMPKLLIEPGKSYHYTFTVTIDGKEYKMMSVFTTNAKPVDPGPGDNSGKDNPSVLYGDVNGDGVVDEFDLTKLCLYFRRRNAETKISTVKLQNPEAADVNASGEIDEFDLTKLCLYFRRRNAETKISTVKLGK